MNSESKIEEAKAEEKHPPTILGWIARVVRLALLALLVGVVGWKMVSEKKEIAFTSEVVTDEIRQQDGGWLVPVEITNEGSHTAHLVRLDVTVAGTEETVEIPMIGASETVRYVIRTEAPATSASHEVVSYEAP